MANSVHVKVYYSIKTNSNWVMQSLNTVQMCNTNKYESVTEKLGMCLFM